MFDCASNQPMSCGGVCSYDVECTQDNCSVQCSGATTTCNFTLDQGSVFTAGCNDGATCGFDVRGTSNVTVTCGGSSCDVDCRDASNCLASCTSGSTCLLQCAGASNCNFSSCSSPLSCANNVKVCGRACP